jgi:beta-phosphoglucomutase
MNKVIKHINDNNIKGILFDLNGTMINDVEYHVQAWHKVVNDLGRNISIEEMRHQVYGKNEELLERMFPSKYTIDEMIAIGNEKEEKYRIEFLTSLKLMDGLMSFLNFCASNNIKLAIGSAAIMPNIDFVLDNLNIRHYFTSIVCGDDVVNSKPDPEVFLKCAEGLQLSPQECIVFEDVPKGVLSAKNAGINSVVVLSSHNIAEFIDYDSNIIDYIYDFKM